MRSVLARVAGSNRVTPIPSATGKPASAEHHRNEHREQDESFGGRTHAVLIGPLRVVERAARQVHGRKPLRVAFVTAGNEPVVLACRSE